MPEIFSSLSMESKRLELIVFGSLFLGLSRPDFFVFKPFLGIIVLAAVLSVLFYPLYKKLIGIFHGNRSLSAFILVVASLIFVIIPLLILGLQIFNQAQNFFSLTQVGQGQYVQSIQTNLNTLISHFIPGFSVNIRDYVGNILFGFGH